MTAALVLAATLWAGAQVWDPQTRRFQIGLDVSANRLVPPDDADSAFYERARRIFGNDESVVVALHGPDVFSPEMLEAIARITRELGQIEGVRVVTSLANARSIGGSPGALRVAPLFDAVPRDPGAREAIRREALSNPVFAGNLVSLDARTALIQVEFREIGDSELAARGIDEQVIRIAQAHANGAQVWVAGAAHLKLAQIRTQIGELSRFLPIIVGVLAAMLALAFRSLRGVLLPLLAVGVSLIWTMAAARWIGKPLNLVTILVPPLQIILGLSYSVVVVAEFHALCRAEPGLGARALSAAVVRRVWLPLVLAAVTTAAGFLSMTLNPLRAVAEFGLLALVGVIAALIASLTLAPALLAALGRPRRVAQRREHADLFGRLAGRVAEFDLRHRRQILWAWGGAVVLALLAATQLRVSSDSIRSFAPSVPVRRDFEAINAQLGGANPLEIVIDGGQRGALLDPELLQSIDALERWLESRPEIGGVTSALDFLKLMNRAFSPEADGALDIPARRDLIGQMLFFGGGDELESYIDSSHQFLRLAVRTSLVESHELWQLVREIERRAAELPAPLHAQVTGNNIVIQGLIDDLVRGQFSSIGLTLALIWLLLSGMFLSARVGLLALIPNALPIVIFFGALGASGVPLNFGTSLIAPMALGIAADDTIHYFSRFHSEAKRLVDERLATIHSLRSAGRAMTFTAALVCAGFLTLTWSDLLTWRQLGAMAALTLGVGWIADLTLTPVLCSGLRVATMWDALSLDLGPRPQESIPLFRGLSNLECRVAALIPTIRRIPAGQRLLSAGEQGREMFVVIDGALQVSVEHPDGKREVLNICKRGDVVGEVGFFFQRRSADVDVIEDARLLRLTQKNMEKLTGRYPRIAAKVLRNLGQIMAERLSNTTDRLARA